MAAFISILFAATLLLAGISLYISREALSGQDLRPPPFNFSVSNQRLVAAGRRVYDVVESKSVLFPEWIVFVISDSSQTVNGDDGDGDDYASGSTYHCVFPNNMISPAMYAGRLPKSGRRSFKCAMPSSVRGHRPFIAPVLTKSQVNSTPELAIDWASRPHLMRWTRLVYDSISTASDVVLFAKGVNRPSRVRSPSALRCVFTDESTNRQFKTPVTSSEQEVFRCRHPQPVPEGSKIGLTLEIVDDGQQQERVSSKIIPSVAVYAPFQNNDTETQSFSSSSSSSLCACTMVHNVGKFLKEWVMYHSGVGVKKYVLYDNDSDEADDLSGVVRGLVEDGYKVETVFWPWPKAQEAGFSHSVLSLKRSCQWMMYVDVDEFVFSPKWRHATKPSPDMLQSMLPRLNDPGSKQVGQVMIQCHDFGPSNQTEHPSNGVTQGYTCRRKLEERHKSIVLLEAVDDSLQNSVHHFKLRSGVYRSAKVGVEKAVVNHYKYQAWPEFKTKFKRRVSTYVPDWTQKVNLMSKDRTPGLGVEAVEPEDWAMKFCEVVDTKLQLLTQKWFGHRPPNQSSIKMAWER
uniref:Glycosyltransferase family 92 protein n=1 Tax=Kalanchoe fedtschenkoi TaxID=63787 RepID=A0A7N0UUI9_KALFE